MSSTERAVERKSEREAMVERQLRARGVRSESVLAAMSAVLRHAFVPESLKRAAYEDRALGIGEGQTISQPYMVARTCELLDLKAEERVLEIGAGSGYQAAVLARLSGSVIAIELLATLAERARRTLAALHVDNVRVLVGDGTRGYLAEAPYDAIVVSAGAPDVPDALYEQLADNGRLLIPVGPDSLQTLTLLRKTSSGLVRERYDDCVYVPLRGSGGWADRKPTAPE